MITAPNKDLPPEATISINGRLLTYAESMTVRVALGAFLISLSGEGLGTDVVGRGICEGYKRCIRDVLNIVHRDGG